MNTVGAHEHVMSKVAQAIKDNEGLGYWQLTAILSDTDEFEIVDAIIELLERGELMLATTKVLDK